MIDSDHLKQKINIVEDLFNAGTCVRCIIRLLGGGHFDSDEPHEKLNNLLEGQWQTDEHNAKKTKSNPCSICLDLLKDTFINEMVSSPALADIEKYDADKFVNFVSLPPAILIREYSMTLYVREKYEEYYKLNGVFPLNKAWSYTISKRLAERINKQFQKNASFQVQFNTTYEDDESESAVMYKIVDLFRKTNVVLSRNNIGDALNAVNNEVFKKHVAVPPPVPANSIQLSKITFKCEAVYLAGRYCKYSRNLGQTPWVVKQVKICDNSVQDIIFEQLKTVFDCATMVFIASGREDCNVRMLGRGRPFLVKLCDSRVTKATFAQFRQLEKQINESKLVKVSLLQFVERDSIDSIKKGEEFKKKTYCALCIVDKPENLSSYIEKINSLTSVVVQQKTPIRVFHRRSGATRQKEIFSLSASTIKDRDNLFELILTTQAGTYVKEFVHGDLGRTKPNLRTIIGGHVDIVTLDVLEIDLDYPKAIPLEEKIDSNILT